MFGHASDSACLCLPAEVKELSKKISLTQLVDVIARNGRNKAKMVFSIQRKLAEPYDPKKDHYRALRRALQEAHGKSNPKGYLDAFMCTVTEPARAKRYASLVRAYKRWIGRKKIDQFDLLPSAYEHMGIAVRINPELGLVIDGKPHVLKLYMKDQPLRRGDAEVIAALMRHAYGDGQSVHYAVLDVQTAKLHSFDPDGIQVTIAMVDAELAYIAELWRSAPKMAA